MFDTKYIFERVCFQFAVSLTIYFNGVLRLNLRVLWTTWFTTVPAMMGKWKLCTSRIILDVSDHFASSSARYISLLTHVDFCAEVTMGMILYKWSRSGSESPFPDSGQNTSLLEYKLNRAPLFKRQILLFAHISKLKQLYLFILCFLTEISKSSLYQNFLSNSAVIPIYTIFPEESLWK